MSAADERPNGSGELEPLLPKPKRLTLSDIVEQQLAALTRSGSEHSSVKLTRNSRGDVQIEVTVRTGEGDVGTVAEAALLARKQYDHLASIYPMRGEGDE